MAQYWIEIEAGIDLTQFTRAFSFATTDLTEIALDGGYWYTAQAVQDARGNWTPGNMPSGFCADYADIDGTKYAFIRRPAPVTLPAAPLTVDTVVSAAGYFEKPQFRVGGL